MAALLLETAIVYQPWLLFPSKHKNCLTRGFQHCPSEISVFLGGEFFLANELRVQ